jgi:hypothetical protein
VPDGEERGVTIEGLRREDIPELLRVLG